MVLAIVIILLVVGSVIFHFVSPWWFTPIASNWSMMDDTVKLTFSVTGAVFVLVNLFLAYAVIRYRHKQGSKALYRPEDAKLEWWLTGITTIGVAALLTPGLFVWAKFVTVPSDAAVVEVVGQQWNWSYRFPGKDGKLGATDAALITPENPFGIDPKDPRGQDDVLIASPELHIPLNKPVKILLRSRDVTHQFAVPQFRVKMDMVPGMVSYFWFTPTRTGGFNVLCEQLCGIAHFAMRGRVVVDEQPQFDAWLASQPTFADVHALQAGDPAAGAALYAVCSACHGPAGQGNPQLNAPRLAGQPSWYLDRQLHGFRQGWRGASPQDAYGSQMAPMAATLADDAAVRNVIAYIGTFPDAPAASTVAGDAAHGKALYSTCSFCHGDAGEGNWATKGARLAGMSDWYMARQLRNFRSGVRGGHALDFAGAQMLQMSQISGVLKDDRAIDDLAAYLGGLR
jgi:cytochrome c oxidase subunit 2